MADDRHSFDEKAALARLAGDRDLLREIAAIYVESHRELIGALRDAIGAGDAEGARAAAHSIKGTVANFGAPHATAAALELEQMGRDGRLEAAGAKLDELQGEAERLAAELAAYCGPSS